MVRMNVGVEVIIGMARKAIALDGGPLPFSITQMAFGACSQRVHAGQRESRATVNLEHLHVVPSSGRMTAVAPRAQSRLMRILVARVAFALHAPLPTMTTIASDRLVPSGQWKAGSRMVEAFPLLASCHVPSGWRVAIGAVEAFGDRVVPRRSGGGLAPVRIFGQRHAHQPG
jgi:hypothetical protein